MKAHVLVLSADIHVDCTYCSHVMQVHDGVIGFLLFPIFDDRVEEDAWMLVREYVPLLSDPTFTIFSL